MRQGVVITGVLVVIGLATAVIADGGWDGMRRDLSALTNLQMPTPFAAAAPTRNAQQTEASVREAIALAHDIARGLAKANPPATDGDLVFVDADKAAARAMPSSDAGALPAKPADGGDAVRAMQIRAEIAADSSTPLDRPAQDYGAALNWYSLANDPANAEARYAIGHDLLAGEEPRVAEGARFLRAAAELGHPLAALELAELYVEGVGFERNYARAFMWYAIAQRGDIGPSAQALVADRLSRLGRAMMPDEMAEAEGLIRDWKPLGKDALPDVDAVTSAVVTGG